MEKNQEMDDQVFEAAMKNESFRQLMARRRTGRYRDQLRLLPVSVGYDVFDRGDPGHHCPDHPGDWHEDGESQRQAYPLTFTGK